MLSCALAPAFASHEGEPVQIECDISNGLPGFVIVGLADKAVGEARERVRSAIRNSRLVFPPKRFTLNLAPADVPKDGTGYDAGIAAAILAATGQIPRESLEGVVFAAELALDGTFRPVRGIIAAAQMAGRIGRRRIYVAAENADEAALVTGVEVIPVRALRDLYLHLIGESLLAPAPHLPPAPRAASAAVDFSAIYGQQHAKRALEIAAAGGHNILLSGPPGAGKTMMAKALAGIMPLPAYEEIMEITHLHGLAGITRGSLVLERPFRSPHHTASSVSIVGGGASPKPGEISLSHRGILFLDELPEFPRVVLESLRQPLEDGVISVARAAGTVTFPAAFMLVATRNPCPCGYAGDPRIECSCTAAQAAKYIHRISGPLLDRIDLHVEVERTPDREIVSGEAQEPSEEILKRVQKARSRQRRPGQEDLLNAQLQDSALRSLCRLNGESQMLARQAVSNLQLSGRSYTKILRVARTIADLEASDRIETRHLAEALQYRSRI